MSVSEIPLFPAIPSRSAGQATFDAQADAFFGHLDTFVSAANAYGLDLENVVRAFTDGNLYTVQTSSEDTVSGRVLRLFGDGGSFGLGGSIARDVSDLDALNHTQFFRETGATGTPAGGASTVGLHVSRSSDAAIQIVARQTVDAIWWRRKDVTWQPWQKLFHPSSLLGSVSESGGIATGAAQQKWIENANGRYMRMANGLQICKAAIVISSGVQTASGNVFISDSYSWTYPAEFSEIPSSSGLPISQLTVAHTVLGSVASTTAITSFRVERPTASTSTTGKIEVTAIGPWFTEA